MATKKEVREMVHSKYNFKCGNKWKNTFTIDQFKKEVSEQIKRLNDYSSNYRMAKKYGLIQEAPKEIVFHFEQHQTQNTKVQP